MSRQDSLIRLTNIAELILIDEPKLADTTELKERIKEQAVARRIPYDSGLVGEAMTRAQRVRFRL